MEPTVFVPISALPREGLIRQPWRQPGFPLRRSEVYRRAQQNTFPPPVKIGVRASAWRVGDVQDWLRDPMGWSASTGSAG